MSAPSIKAGECWLILGASSAIAREFARAAARDGADLMLAGRDLADLRASAADLRARYARRVEAIDFDALSATSHAAVVKEADSFAGAGTLNVFLAFGTMPAQDAIDADPALVAEVIAANYTGAAQVLHRLAPVFELRRAGRIAVLGSVAGDRGRRSNYVYGSAKAGLHTYLGGLRSRLFRCGVTVTTIKPGPVDTAMTWGLKKLPLLATPEAVAESCLRAAKQGREVVYIPAPWRLIMAILRAIPERMFKKLDI